MEHHSDGHKGKPMLFYSMLNYTLLFLIAGLLMYLLFQLVSIYVGSYMCKMPLKWATDTVKPLIPESAWDMYRVKRFFTYNAYVVFIAALFFSFMFLSKLRKRGYLKIFYFWLALHGFNLSIGNIIASIITKTGIYYPLLWLRVSDVAIMILGASAAAALLVIGGVSTRVVFLTALSRSCVASSRARDVYLLKMFIVPWILGSLLLIFGVKINPFMVSDFPSYEWLIAFPMGLIFFPMFIFHRRKHESEFVLIKERRAYKINIALLFLVGFLIALYRLILIDGLRV